YRNPVSVGPEVLGDLSTLDMEGPAGLVTVVPRLQRLFDGVRKIAASSETVLLQGESGTGKEVVAQSIHELSGRQGRFVAINCGALPDTLIEGQLFGYVKGAFSGADDDRDGLVQAAHGGTLFLDEIGELSPRAQAALLRVLQEKEVLRVGATSSTSVDLRLVVASLRDLERMVDEGRFRDDLFGRVAGMKVGLPPLRERREDLGLLAGRLLARQTDEPVRLTVRAARALFRHPWPRNIRELDKALGTARVLADGEPISREHLPEELRTRRPPRATVPVQDLSEEDRKLRDELVTLLREHEGNVTRVAEAMGKKRQQIQKWCRRLGIDAATFRSSHS
ncbi:MAG: sigma 54-interacting transcriptional regulator, partial [Polyangiaceae bacterium]